MLDSCPMKISVMSISIALNLLLLVSYDISINMDWLVDQKTIINCYKKTFECLSDDGKEVKL